MLVKVFILLCLLLGVSSHPSEPTYAFEDDFSGPYNPLNPHSPYGYAFTDVDNLVVTNNAMEGRLTQVSNPFTTTVPQTFLGGLDHIKVLQYIKTPFTPGPVQKLVKCEARIGAQHYGVDDHPFPEELVRNPQDDPRLAVCALNSVNYEHLVVADIMLTNNGIWALYERLPFLKNETYNYHAFTQMKKVGSRTPDDMHKLSIEYDAKWKSLTWRVDGMSVMSVYKIGHPLVDSDIVTLIDHGGEDEIVEPLDFSYGFGCFTLLDGIDPHNPSCPIGLVRLDWNYEDYVSPSGFFDDVSLESNRLWGQGSAITVGRITVQQH